MTHDEMNAATYGLTTKSAKIRELDKLGATRTEIAAYLSIRYQHVRNVLIAPPPKTPDKRNLSLSDGKTSDSTRALSIEEAKQGLARQFGVPTSKIEITIRG